MQSHNNNKSYLKRIIMFSLVDGELTYYEFQGV